MEFLTGLAWLLLFQCAGEAVARLVGLTVPGPVVGMALCFGALFLPVVRRSAGVAADRLLGHLSLLFIPVGVGVVVHLGLFADWGWRLLVVIVLSTWIGLAVTALVFHALRERTDA